MKIIYLEDYLDNRPDRVRRPIKDFDEQIADLNRQIVKCNKEADIIDKEIAEYKAEAEESAKSLKESLFSAINRAEE